MIKTYSRDGQIERQVKNRIEFADQRPCERHPQANAAASRGKRVHTARRFAESSFHAPKVVVKIPDAVNAHTGV
jgi:hypothetical protein